VTKHADGLFRVECTEVHDLMSRLQGLSAIGISLRSANYAGTLSHVDLGDVGIQIVRSAPVLWLGASLEVGTGLVQAIEGSEHARWNGQAMAPNAIAVCEGGRQHEAIYPDDFACAILHFTDAAADRIAPLARTAGDIAVSRDQDACSGFAEIARAVEAALASSPAVLRDAEARRALRATILDTAQGLAAEDGASAPRVRDGRTRQRIVHAADDYLRANPARPVYTDELCAAVGTSATRLHQAFHATFGISPHRYLKMRRMGMVRAMLLSRSSPWRSVKAAALSHGFWHLGQFAHDYRALYGEAPSETHARARPESTGPLEDGLGDDQ
jgi:AraC family ethanolamine operon transcriptional activator